ncbi:MAG: HD domain-containing protein [Deltaproteobacteria bacterium]|jgi:HD-GYP domain-containing protein (c-di-GMP phosphodiesterase class II)|nr:HD domain-containing protein [Deltaproteobacteria bacterium]
MSQAPLAKPKPKSQPQGTDLPELLAQSILRLPQLVRIHQPNNKIFKENLILFIDTLNALWNIQNGQIDIRLHRGRLYINKERIAFSPALLVTSTKLMEFFESRRIFGFGFRPKEDLDAEEVVEFIQIVNASQNHEKPGVFLSEALKDDWVKPILDDDFKIAYLFTDEMASEGAPGRPLVWNSTPSEEGGKARRAYSRAMSEFSKLNDSINSAKGLVNFSKSRRVVQDLAESLFQNENILLSLSTIRDYDDYTCSHCVNVAILSMCLGRRLGLSKMEVATLGLGGLFHDLGKVDIPIELIRKPGKFTEVEYEEIKKHPLNSVCRILSLNADNAFKSKLFLPPFEHHININHSGYPATDLKAPVSLFGRIVAITDLYDALTSSRSYRPVPISPDKALEIMVKKSGSEIDALLLKVFINMVGIYPVGTLLVLNTKEVVMVADTPPNAEAGRPRAYILEREEETLKKGELIDLAEKNAKGQFARKVLYCFHPTEFGLVPTDILL